MKVGMNSPKKVAHIGIAVTSLTEALAFYRDQLGLSVTEIVEDEDRGIRIAMVPCGDCVLEFMEPLGPSSQISRFLARRGQGVHHVCLEVEDVQERLDALADSGVQLVNQRAEIGAEGVPVAFVHPRAAGGVLVELIEES